MPGSLTIEGARLVLPDRVVTGDIVVEDGLIVEVAPHASRTAGEIISGKGLTVLPGVVDSAVRCGPSPWEDWTSASHAAAAGGVTSILDLPDGAPPTTTLEALHAKLALAHGKSCVHYGAWLAATPGNVDALEATDRAVGLVVDLGRNDDLAFTDFEALDHLFAHTQHLVAVHPEMAGRLAERWTLYEQAQELRRWSKIRDFECGLSGIKLVHALATRHGTDVHVLDLSSAEEVDALTQLDRARFTAQVAYPHIMLHAENAYEVGGVRVIHAPPIRGRRHAEALLHALQSGVVHHIGSDHGPCGLDEKSGPLRQANTGMPGVEHLLPFLLDLFHQERVTLRQIAKWTSEAPARRFGIPRKGRLETGYDGDLVVVDTQKVKTLSDDQVLSKGGWTPFAGKTLTGWPVMTVVLGKPVFREGQRITGVHGRELVFQRETGRD